MKIITVMLVIILAFFAISIFGHTHMRNTAEGLSKKLDRIEDFIKKEDWASGQEYMDELKVSWTRVKKTWTIIINHQEIDNIDVTVTRIDRFIKTREKPSSMAEIAALKLYILHIPEKEAFRLNNLL